MDFGTAIKTCFSKFGTFEGTAGKAEFWYFYLLGMVLNVASYFIDLNYLLTIFNAFTLRAACYGSTLLLEEFNQHPTPRLVGHFELHPSRSSIVL